MERILAKFYESDLLDLLDGKKTSQKDFFKLLILYLLENRTINVNEVNELSEELKGKYNDFIEYLDKELGNGLGDLIKLLRNSKKQFKEMMNPIVEKLEGMKNGHNSKNNADEITQMD